VELEAIILVRFNEQGQIVEFKVFVRPLPGLATLFAALPPRVSARRRGRLKGALAAFLTRPLAFALRIADRLTPRFLWSVHWPPASEISLEEKGNRR
jgi:hypothetical protein